MFSSGALSDIRVVDLTQMLAGPFCTQVLADQGAQVVKVEPLEGEGMRRTGPFLPDDRLRSFGGYFQSVNRNKGSIALDLKNPEGRQVLKELVASADVLVENFRGGVMERLGLSYEELSQINPALVYAAVRGFGDRRSGESPYYQWPAYDVVAQAMGGIMGITGPDEHSPTKIGPGVGDTVPALMLAIGILSAVHHARRTGQGQFVDVSMVDCVLALTERIVYQHSYQGSSPKPEGNRHPLLCPFGLFLAKDGWVSIACATDALWRKLAHAMGRPELAESAECATNAARVEHADFVIRALEAFTSQRTKDELKGILGGVVPFGPVYTAEDVFEDAHFHKRDMLVEVDHPGSDHRVTIAGVPIKLSRTPGGIARRAPMVGEDTDHVLRSIGMTADRIQELRATGAVG
ncbi:CaiB/BaiF CoA-transferase family protein [Variovorax sp. 770b2]|uniref:CaiB/BaiF CoA transferase family protein n=1 Tax=Variovorax sp. 770b2 TaxID=1566271 RepID=UPI0008ED42AA|nr:CoA transferase [Variovorax sp. 770b2]SFP91829.1 Crotonobetainyl-CoA:carnitine CoA-transferase CaiB [Variovorax sp. 770b2]